MTNLNNIKKGMQVFSTDNQPFGTVEDVYDNEIVVNGQRIPANMISRYEQNRVFLAGNTTQNYGQQTAGETKVPVAEEQLRVGKREVNEGTVRVHKEVIQEQVNVPVELRREEAQVQKVDTPDRPLRPGEDAFQERTYEVPLMGEEAVVSKEAIVTGEVVVNKTQETERRNIGDTVRRERVEVSENEAQTTPRSSSYQTGQTASYNTAAQTGYEATTTGNTYQSNTNYATTANSGSTGTTGRGQVREGLAVYSSDDDNIGLVKEFTGSEILVDRKLQRDIYVPMSAVQNIKGDQVVLNVPSDQIDGMGWRNPQL